MEELQTTLASKERLIIRLYREKEVMEEEIADLRLCISKLKSKLKTRNAIKLQLTIPTNSEGEPSVELVNVDSD